MPVIFPEIGVSVSRKHHVPLIRYEPGTIREPSKGESKTIGKEAERSRRRELEENYNEIKRRTLPPTFERAGACHLKPVLGSLLLCDIGVSKIASYQAQHKAEKASVRTLNKELQVLRQILRRHKMSGQISRVT